MEETSPGGLFAVNIARVRESLDSLAGDIEFIAHGQADIPDDHYAWEHRVNAGRQLVRLRSTLNNGVLDRADCDLNTLATLRRVWSEIERLEYGRHHDQPDQYRGPLFLPAEIGPLDDGLPLRKVDEEYDALERLKAHCRDSPTARAMAESLKPRLTTKRERWSELPDRLRRLAAQLADKPLGLSGGLAKSRCVMALPFLSDELLRLSGLYPQFRQALAIGDANWLFNESYYHTVEELQRWLRDNCGLEVIGHDMMSNDIRALVIYLWAGQMDSVRADEAIEQFRMLARTAVGCIPLKSFPNRIAPQARCKVSMYPISLSGKYNIVESPSPDDRDFDWIGHVFASISPSSRKFWFRQRDSGEPQFCDILVLPFDVFRASLFALRTNRADNGVFGKETDVKLDNATMTRGGDNSLPAGLDRNNVAILFSLLNRAPALLTLDDIVASAKVSRDTASKALNELIADGLACRPKGNRKGATVTEKGRNMAGQIRR